VTAGRTLQSKMIFCEGSEPEFPHSESNTIVDFYEPSLTYVSSMYPMPAIVVCGGVFVNS
jgi:hypothetical protein